MMTFLATDSLSVAFGGLAAVKNLSIDIKQGKVHGLIGPNGAGKTTLINAISGLVPLSGGRILFDGSDIARLPPNRRARLGIGRTFQHAEAFPDQTVLSNVMTGLFLRGAWSIWRDLVGSPGKWRAERRVEKEAFDLLERFGIVDYAAEPASELPFGILKKLDLARALAGRPRLLMLDEPTSGLSEEEAGEVIMTCRDLAGDLGMTLVIVEHNMRVIMSLADTITVLDNGEVIAEGPPEAVQRDARVIEAYLGAEAASARN